MQDHFKGMTEKETMQTAAVVQWGHNFCIRQGSCALFSMFLR